MCVWMFALVKYRSKTAGWPINNDCPRNKKKNIKQKQESHISINAWVCWRVKRLLRRKAMCGRSGSYTYVQTVEPNAANFRRTDSHVLFECLCICIDGVHVYVNCVDLFGKCQHKRVHCLFRQWLGVFGRTQFDFITLTNGARRFQLNSTELNSLWTHTYIHTLK